MKKVFLIMALAITVFACQSETKTEEVTASDSTTVAVDSTCADTTCADSCKKAEKVK